MKKYDIKYCAPLQFMITDKTGHTATVEPRNGRVIIKDNHVNVLPMHQA